MTIFFALFILPVNIQTGSIVKTNIASKVKTFTHEGGTAKIVNAEHKLRRSVLSCFLFENTFYEDGVEIAQRIRDLVQNVNTDTVSKLAIEARTVHNLRHCPLWLLNAMAQNKKHLKVLDAVIPQVINRADEIAEFLAMYWLPAKHPIAAPVKRGLAECFHKFNEYQFAKYNRDAKIKLRDVMFMVHPKPADDKEKELFKRIADNELQTPDTWEVALSAGKDKKATWERLMLENQLGGLAFLRNLRNMMQVNVNLGIITAYFDRANFSRVLPFRFIAAARVVPQFENQLDRAMLKLCEKLDRLKGLTCIVCDVSGSMSSPISDKSDLSRDAASGGVAAVLREVCEDVIIFGFGNNLYVIPPRRGMSLIDMVKHRNEGTYLRGALEHIINNYNFDRLVVITDEQSHDGIANAPIKGRSYLINVAPNQNGVGYYDWIHIDGFSESVIKFITEYEKCQTV